MSSFNAFGGLAEPSCMILFPGNNNHTFCAPLVMWRNPRSARRHSRSAVRWDKIFRVIAALQSSPDPYAIRRRGGAAEESEACTCESSLLGSHRDLGVALVVSRLTWPSQARMTLGSTPDSRRQTAAVCLNTWGLITARCSRVPVGSDPACAA